VRFASAWALGVHWGLELIDLVHLIRDGIARELTPAGRVALVLARVAREPSCQIVPLFDAVRMC
jgi:hypothetical protein